MDTPRATKAPGERVDTGPGLSEEGNQHVTVIVISAPIQDRAIGRAEYSYMHETAGAGNKIYAYDVPGRDGVTGRSKSPRPSNERFGRLDIGLVRS